MQRQAISPKTKYNSLLVNIGRTLETVRQTAVTTVNATLVKANWDIGKYIVEFEQDGNERAEYGTELLAKLSKDIKHRYGKGFSSRNILDMRRFYLLYSKWQALPAKFSWTHFVILLGVSDQAARKFYEKQALCENWSSRVLERQINTSLFERLALSRDKKAVLQLSKKGHITDYPKQIIKDPYVLDFLQIPQNSRLTEKQLEQKIIDNLQLFLLELGQGFAFVGRQYKISLRNKHFYIDLVFYHRILKCFVLIELKTKPVRHNDIGQMNLYLNHFANE